MVEEVLAVHAMKLATEDDVLLVRRRVREIAEMRKFDTFAIAAITTATSELGRNVLVHGGGGIHGRAATTASSSTATTARRWTR